MFSRFILILLGIGILGWTLFAYPTAALLVNYYSFKAFVEPDFINWSIESFNDEVWRAVAEFRYTVKAHTYNKQEVFQGERYRNPYAANVALEKLQKNFKVVWYNPENPSQASMEKFYPTKKSLYSLVTLGLVFYGAWLGSYLTRKWIDRHS